MGVPGLIPLQLLSTTLHVPATKLILTWAIATDKDLTDYLHMTLLSIKQDTLRCTIVLYIFAPHCNAGQIRPRGRRAFLAPQRNILIIYERLFCWMFNIL